EYAQRLKEIFVKGFREHDGEVLKIINLPSGATDVSVIVSQIKALQPQGVYVVGYDEPIVRLLGEIKNQDVLDDKGKPIKLLSCGAFDSNYVYDNACDVAENVIFPRVAFTCETEGTDVKKFCDAFTAKYGHEPDIFAAHGYDALNLLVNTIETQGGLYPEEMPQVLATTVAWSGVSGSVAFDQNGDVTTKFPKIYLVKQCKAVSFDDLMEKLENEERKEKQDLSREIEERRKDLGK
ncbi:ABC transporter substrate-binding protein, partial [Acidobacteriota bacterium]